MEKKAYCVYFCASNRLIFINVIHSVMYHENTKLHWHHYIEAPEEDNAWMKL